MKSYTGEVQKRRTFLLMEHGSSMAAWGHILAHQPGSSPDPGSWGFCMEASLHNWLSHWPLATESTSSPAVLHGGRGVDWTFPPSNHVVGSPGNQPSSFMFSKIHLIYINPKVIEKGLLWILRQLYCSHHLGNSRHFRMSVSEAATKT